MHRDDIELVWRSDSLHTSDVLHADRTLLGVMMVDASGAAVRIWFTIILRGGGCSGLTSKRPNQAANSVVAESHRGAPQPILRC